MALFEASEAIAAVNQDLARGFDGIFEEIDGLRPVGLFAEVKIGAEGVSVMAWEWAVRHVGPLQGTPATGREVTLRGVTIIDGRGGDAHLFSRYIDWLGLYAELGAVTIARPPVDDRRALPGNVPFPESP